MASARQIVSLQNWVTDSQEGWTGREVHSQAGWFSLSLGGDRRHSAEFLGAPGVRHIASTKPISLVSRIRIGQSVQFATVKVMVVNPKKSYAALFFEQQD